MSVLQELADAQAELQRIRDWNAADEGPVDKYYAQALKLLRNKVNKDEIADVIANLLRKLDHE